MLSSLRSPFRLFPVILTSLLFLVLFTGCEEEVTDALDTALPFTIYGYLNPAADTQFVRVFPVSPVRLELAGRDPIDASVGFRNLETGETVAAQDSLVEFFSGRYGHVYFAPFKPEYGARYEIEVERSDGASSSATTDIPPEIESERQEPFTRFRIENEGFVPLLPMNLFGDDMRLLRVLARYEVELLNVGRQIVYIPYEQVIEETSDGWYLEIDLAGDFGRIYESVADLRQLYGEDLIEFYRLDILPEVADPAWDPPGGEFDPIALVEPGTFENVENGFGFFGSAYRKEILYPVDPCLRLLAGFAESPLACGPEQRCKYLEQCD